MIVSSTIQRSSPSHTVHWHNSGTIFATTNIEQFTRRRGDMCLEISKPQLPLTRLTQELDTNLTFKNVETLHTMLFYMTVFVLPTTITNTQVDTSRTVGPRSNSVGTVSCDIGQFICERIVKADCNLLSEQGNKLM